MFGLFRRAHTAGVGSRGRAFLRLEALDPRDQPSSLDPSAAPAADGTPVRVADQQTNRPPEITNFTAREIGSGLFLITGQVVDENPGGLVVTLDGSTSAAGRSTTTNDDGSFSLLVQLATDGTDSGYITATTTDDFGLVSDEVDVFVTPTPP
jgi:hypothetical protein